MKTSWPAGGSAGSGANAGGCYPAATDTGSFSGRSTQLEKAWTKLRFTCVKKVWLTSETLLCVDKDGLRSHERKKTAGTEGIIKRKS